RLLACTAVAVLILVGGLVACEGRPAMTDMEAVNALLESVSYDGQELSFTIPEGERDWNLFLTQNEDDRTIAAYVIQGFNDTVWKPGETYSFQLPVEHFLRDGLTLNVSLGKDGSGITAAKAFGAIVPSITQEAVDALENSISYDGQQVSFTIPEENHVWNIQISGRADTQELGGISLHYLDGTDWTPGETYSFEWSSLAAQDVTKLTMHIFQEDQEWE